MTLRPWAILSVEMVDVARSVVWLSTILVLMPLILFAEGAGKRQLTRTPRNHSLDNNDNYSADNRFLCFDTRATRMTGNGSSTSIMKVDVRTGEETVVYEPKPVVLDPVNAAPGVIAASYNPAVDEVVFIHGPLVSETPLLGFYGKTNRRGAVAPANGKSPVRFLDYRDVASQVTPPGAHRGGTHRHEYSLDGRRVGFTYDDHLLPAYGRTVGMLVEHPKAPGGVSHWSTILVSVVPEHMARPGDLISAAGDSWLGKMGLMRAFIGRVKENDGSYRNSLFVVDVPAHVNVTTADAGTQSRFPAPPHGVRVRRLTHTAVSGIVRGSRDGKRIAYLAQAPDGTTQVFLIDSQGSDAIQATQFPNGVQSVRWHPSDEWIGVLTGNAVAVTDVRPGAGFGRSIVLADPKPPAGKPEGLVWSNDGRQMAFNRRVAGTGKDADGHDFLQIFLVDVGSEVIHSRP